MAPSARSLWMALTSGSWSPSPLTQSGRVRSSIDPALSSMRWLLTNVQNGWIVHTNNGPYPCGQWHDLTVARVMISAMSLLMTLSLMMRCMMACADGGYADGYQFFETPTGHNNPDQCMKAQARARHETINQRFKQRGVMGQRFRGAPSEFHDQFFNAVANLTQFLIMNSGYVPEEDERQFFQVF
jgi:hypothetical protein